MTIRGVRRPRHAVRVAVATLMCAVLASCSSAASEGAGPEQRSAPPSTTTSTPAPKPASLTLSVPKGAEDVAPRKPMTATVTNGKITSAKIVGTHGVEVGGTVAPDGATWRAAKALGYGKTYTLTARAVGEDGEPVTAKATFTTAVPSSTVGVWMNVDDGDTVGVGMPLVFTFSQDIVDKAAAERALRITTEPETEGAFHWFRDDQVTWRPKEYWESGTTVRVNADLYGTHLGDGTFGEQDESAKFRIGERLIAIADGKTHHMRVFVDGKQVRRMPISMGKPSSSTPNGMYTVMSEHNGYTMDSSTYGVPTDSSAGYRIYVDTAVRLSYSGIFYHSAPWSVGYQGNTNTSHGCINLSPEDAAWLMERSKPGDLVQVRKAGNQVLEPTDGWSVWQMSWKHWKAGQHS